MNHMYLAPLERRKDLSGGQTTCAKVIMYKLDDYFCGEGECCGELSVKIALAVLGFWRHCLKYRGVILATGCGLVDTLTLAMCRANQRGYCN